MDRSIFRFTVSLSIVLSVVFGIHLLILNANSLPLFEHKIILAYLVNFSIATGTFIALFWLKEKLRNQLGFLFMGASFLKFIVFFLVFYPDYASDQKMSTLEFSAFFVPYLISLVIEVFALTKMLNKLT